MGILFTTKRTEKTHNWLSKPNEHFHTRIYVICRGSRGGAQNLRDGNRQGYMLETFLDYGFDKTKSVLILESTGVVQNLLHLVQERRVEINIPTLEICI